MQRQTFDRRAIPAAARLSDWTAPDGWTLRRLDWRQPEGAPVRGSLLFASGRADFIEKYVEALAHWHGEGWNVAAFDWRGQGGSKGDVENGHVSSFEPMVEDLAALIADWRGETPGPHVAIGHSMGGHLLLRTLAEKQPGIDAAVLVAPMLMINSAPVPPFAAWWVASIKAMFGLARRPAFPQRAKPSPGGSMRQSILTACPDRYEDELWWWERAPEYNLGSPTWGWLYAAYRSCFALTADKLARMKTPILLLGAERDRLVSAAAIRRAAGRLPAAELHMYPDAAHEILREADAVRTDAFARIDAFLAARAPA
jgi:lysophospholipase